MRFVSIVLTTYKPRLPVNQDVNGEGSFGPLEHVAAAHVNLGIESGFDLAQIMAEYRALRACVLRLWRATDPAGFARGAEEITRFTDAIDQAVAETVPIYAQREAQYRDRFLGILGRDLRNPLNAILLSATALAGGKELDEKQLGGVSRILSGVRRVDHMVNDILDFARGRLGTPMPITVIRANLETLVLEIADEVQSANPGVPVDVDTNGDLSGKWDTEKIETIALEPITKCDPARQREQRRGDRQQRRQFSVARSVQRRSTNTGRTAGNHVRSAGSREKLGSKEQRLGLFIVNEIVSAHRGTIAVTSSEEAGTIFSVRLPRHLPWAEHRSKSVPGPRFAYRHERIIAKTLDSILSGRELVSKGLLQMKKG